MNIYIKILTATFLLSFQSFSMPVEKELNSKELRELDSGQQILKTEEVKGLPWPKIVIYQKIRASALESMAVFYAIEHQKNYIPNLEVSKVIKQPKAEQTHVKYVMKMPWPISDSKYTHGHILSSPTSSSYKVRWWMIKSNVTDRADGYALFQNYRDGSIMKYSSLVEPKSMLANLIESTMLKDVAKTMKVTKKEIERVKKRKPNDMRKYVSFILNSLSGKFTYKK